MLSFDEATPAHTAIALTVAGYLFRVFGNEAQGKPLLLLEGPKGTGKSHLSRAVLHWTQNVSVEAWRRGYWGNPPQCCRFAWSQVIDGPGIYEQAVNDDVVILDDVGAEIDRFKTGEPTEILRRFLDQREGRFTVMTTNVPPAEWATRWDARVADRLLATTTQHVSFNALPSWRINPMPTA